MHDLAAVRPEDVLIEDIAISLARQHRAYGHSPITVAQHSVHVAWLVEREYPDLRLLTFEALMHDACESLMGDVASPVKAQCVDVRALEQRIWRESIAVRYSLPAETDPRVKRCDLISWATERRDHFVWHPRWPDLGVEPDVRYLDALSIAESYALFMRAFDRLCPAHLRHAESVVPDSVNRDRNHAAQRGMIR